MSKITWARASLVAFLAFIYCIYDPRDFEADHSKFNPERRACVLIGGATGKVGSALVYALAGMSSISVKPYCILALTRTPNSTAAARLKALAGVEIVQGDYRDSLEHAFIRSRAAFLACSNYEGQKEAEINFIEQASKWNLPYMVKVSTATSFINNLEIEAGTWHREIEEALQKSTVPHTILRPNWFIQNLERDDFLPHLYRSGVWSHPTNHDEAQMVDTRDVADVAAALLSLEMEVTETVESHLGNIYDISGPEGWTMRRVAEYVNMICNKGERQYRSEEIKLEEFAKLLPKGEKDRGAWKSKSILASWRDVWMQGGFNVPSSPHVKDLLPDPRGVKDFVTEYMESHFPEDCRA